MTLPDEFGYKCDYIFDIDTIFKNFNSIKTEEFVLENILSHTKEVILGVNPFDLYILKNFISFKSIKKVTEFGCGSTTALIRSLGVECHSFALSDQSNSGVVFNKCNILDSANIILEDCKTSGLVLIDSWHSSVMAEFYHKELFGFISLPVFLHDWFAPMEDTYSEQVYFAEKILDKQYELFLMTRLLNSEIYDFCKIQPCSAIFTKI